MRTLTWFFKLAMKDIQAFFPLVQLMFSLMYLLIIYFNVFKSSHKQTTKILQNEIAIVGKNSSLRFQKF